MSTSHFQPDEPYLTNLRAYRAPTFASIDCQCIKSIARAGHSAHGQQLGRVLLDSRHGVNHSWYLAHVRLTDQHSSNTIPITRQSAAFIKLDEPFLPYLLRCAK